jgi:hypothetical protein
MFELEQSYPTSSLGDNKYSQDRIIVLSLPTIMNTKSKSDVIPAMNFDELKNGLRNRLEDR